MVSKNLILKSWRLKTPNPPELGSNVGRLQVFSINILIFWIQAVKFVPRASRKFDPTAPHKESKTATFRVAGSGLTDLAGV